MTLKQAIILLLIIFLAPVVLGKASLAPFADFLTHPSLDNFTMAFKVVWQQDWAFYKGLVMPWVSKLIDLLKGNIPAGVPSIMF